MSADGGPAFPRTHNGFCGETIESWFGMTLRDYFAGQALAGISAHTPGPTVKPGESASTAHARWSYAVADAMIAARGVTSP